GLTPLVAEVYRLPGNSSDCTGCSCFFKQHDGVCDNRAVFKHRIAQVHKTCCWASDKTCTLCTDLDRADNPVHYNAQYQGQIHTCACIRDNNGHNSTGSAVALY